MDCTTREEAHRKKINPATEEISFDDNNNNNNNAMQLDAGRKAERGCEAAFLSGRRKTRGKVLGIDRTIDRRFLRFFFFFFFGVCVSLFPEIPTRMTCCQTAVS
jgi:hypothetical protein